MKPLKTNTLLTPRKVVTDKSINRKMDTIKACMMVHGATSSNKVPLIFGLTNKLFKSFHPKRSLRKL